MTALNPASTPVASSKTAALSRVLDSVTKGYVYYTAGTCPAEKVVKLAKKFHERYGIGCSPAQRMTRKKKGLANAVLVLYLPAEPEDETGGSTDSALESGLEAEWASGLYSRSCAGLDSRCSADEAKISEPALASYSEETPPFFAQSIPASTEADTASRREAKPTRRPLHSEASGQPTLSPSKVSWVVLATEGTGPVHEQEQLRSVLDARRLLFLGYELVRYAVRGKTSWTWRRTKQEVADLYALLASQLNAHHPNAVAQTLQRIGCQPGFSGVRKQSWALCQFARSRGYAGELPYLYFVEKVRQGERLVL